MSLLRSLLMLPLLALAGCATDAARHWVELDGARYQVELATNDETRARGLMFRDQMAADHGMLFIHDREEMQAYWMKNTRIALDILYFDSQRRLVSQQRDVPPCSAGARPAGCARRCAPGGPWACASTITGISLPTLAQPAWRRRAPGARVPRGRAARPREGDDPGCERGGRQGEGAGAAGERLVEAPARRRPVRLLRPGDASARADHGPSRPARARRPLDAGQRRRGVQGVQQREEVPGAGRVGGVPRAARRDGARRGARKRLDNPAGAVVGYGQIDRGTHNPQADRSR